jgi:hypothetical protein
MYDEKPGEARRAFRLHGGEAAACLSVKSNGRKKVKLSLARKGVPAAAKLPGAKTIRALRPFAREDLLESACALRPFRRGKSVSVRRKPHFN